MVTIRAFYSLWRALRQRTPDEELVRTRHLRYVRKYFPHQTILFGWRATPTMRASKVQTSDGRQGVIVTTLLLDGKIYHDVERYRPHHDHAHH